MSGGLFGDGSEDYALRLASLEIGAMKIGHIPSVSHQSKNEFLLLGQRFLEHFVVTLNYPAGKMELVPADITLETNISTYGLMLKKEGMKCIVSGIWNNLQTAHAGIAVGDELLSVNAISAKALSLMELQQMFLDRNNDTLVIEYLHDNSRRSATIHKKPLLPEVNSEVIR
jgi:hypothetical protein